MMRSRVGSSFDDEATFSGAEVEQITAALSTVPSAGAVACGIADPSTRDCPNMKEVGGGFEGERYRCAVCGKGYFLDYEDMK
jgi:hypothetical protein